MLERFEDEVRAAATAGCYLLALTAALTVPDVGVAASQPDGQSNGVLYLEWFDEWLGPQFDTGDPATTLDASNCYKLRCKLLHEDMQLQPTDARGTSRLLFLGPQTPVTIDRGQFNEALILDIPMFVDRVFGGFREWEAAHADDPIVRGNADHLMQLHRFGLPPYISGLPVYG